MRRVGLLVAAGLATWCWVAEAHADSVEPPPEDCPRGLEGVYAHYGPSCVPKPCSEGCGLLEHCESVSYCIREETVTLRGGHKEQHEFVRSHCGPNGECTEAMGGEKYPCTVLEVCVRGEADPDDPSKTMPSRCGCRAPGGNTHRGAAWLVFAALALALGAGRRRASALRSLPTGSPRVGPSGDGDAR